MFDLLRVLPKETKINFLSKRFFAYIFSGFIVVASFASFFSQSLNFGIDFSGGILIEVQTTGKADLEKIRQDLSLFNPDLQSIGNTGDEVMIRIQPQGEDEESEMQALSKAKELLGDQIAEYRRIEVVGPKVGGELIRKGIYAVIFALLAIACYIWFRFELPFAVGALVALVHDVITTIGLFSILQINFDLSTVAAVLAIAGYSINDTVVSYDRVRENLRKFRKMPILDLLNLSINQMLSRTLLTSFTTLLAILSIYFFGGEVLKSFAIALLWGITVGTYSSVYIAVPLLTYFNLREEDH